MVLAPIAHKTLYSVMVVVSIPTQIHAIVGRQKPVVLHVQMVKFAKPVHVFVRTVLRGFVIPISMIRASMSASVGLVYKSAAQDSGEHVTVRSSPPKKTATEKMTIATAVSTTTCQYWTAPTKRASVSAPNVNVHLESGAVTSRISSRQSPCVTVKIMTVTGWSMKL
tara:strand:+ start:4161 stop:4661 length:501 start_codon:yes stop_codon:yes gene_type:complete